MSQRRTIFIGYNLKFDIAFLSFTFFRNLSNPFEPHIQTPYKPFNKYQNNKFYPIDLYPITTVYALLDNKFHWPKRENQLRLKLEYLVEVDYWCQYTFPDWSGVVDEDALLYTSKFMDQPWREKNKLYYKKDKKDPQSAQKIQIIKKLNELKKNHSDKNNGKTFILSLKEKLLHRILMRNFYKEEGEKAKSHFKKRYDEINRGNVIDYRGRTQDKPSECFQKIVALQAALLKICNNSVYRQFNIHPKMKVLIKKEEQFIREKLPMEKIKTPARNKTLMQMQEQLESLAQYYLKDDLFKVYITTDIYQLQKTITNELRAYFKNPLSKMQKNLSQASTSSISSSEKGKEPEESTVQLAPQSSARLGNST